MFTRVLHKLEDLLVELRSDLMVDEQDVGRQFFGSGIGQRGQFAGIRPLTLRHRGLLSAELVLISRMQPVWERGVVAQRCRLRMVHWRCRVGHVRDQPLRLQTHSRPRPTSPCAARSMARGLPTLSHTPLFRQRRIWLSIVSFVESHCADYRKTSTENRYQTSLRFMKNNSKTCCLRVNSSGRESYATWVGTVDSILTFVTARTAQPVEQFAMSDRSTARLGREKYRAPTGNRRVRVGRPS